MKKLVIFGGSGFVGGNLTKLAQSKGWKVYIADSLYRQGIGDTEWKTVDITDKKAVDALIEEVRPSAAVNLAAIADIDKAEKDKELARRVNVEGAGNIAQSCAARGIRYVFFSSDAVFNGKGTGYTEEDPPDPVNFYGRTKAEAEKAVRQLHPKAAVVRISLVLGLPVTGGNSFIAGLQKKLMEGKTVVCPTDEVRTPVDVHTLSECVLELAENDFSGIVQVGATNSVDRYTLSRKLAIELGLDEKLVRPSAAGDNNPDRAPRHKNGIIKVAKAQKLFKTPLLSVDETVKRAVADRLYPII